MTRTTDTTRFASYNAAHSATWSVRAAGLSLAALVTFSVLSSLGGVADEQYLSAQADQATAATAYAAASSPKASALTGQTGQHTARI
jgi:hypothetical protein